MSGPSDQTDAEFTEIGDEEATSGAAEIIDADPIDTDTIEQVTSSSSGPGWFALGLTAVGTAIASLAGAYILIGQAAPADGSSVANQRALDRYEERLAALETVSAERASAIEQFETQVIDLGSAIDRLASSGSGAPDDVAPALSDLQARVDTLAADLQAIEIPSTETALTAFDQRLSAIEGAQDALIADTNAETEDRLTALSGRLQSLGDELSTLSEGLTVARSQIESLIQTVASEGQETASDIRAVQASVDDTSRQLETVRDAADNSLRVAESAVALSLIETASITGDPFETALASLATHYPRDPAVAMLRPIAPSGALTRAQLVASFDQVERAILDQRRSAAGEGGGLGWLTRTLGDGVEIRRKGAPDPNTGTALAEAREHLEAGQLTDAVAVLNALPANEKPLVEPWIATANNRASLDRGLTALMQRLLDGGDR